MATIRDVASKAGVSFKTVSRVINNAQYISDATRMKVEAAIAELGYVPDVSARSLAMGKSFSVGLVIPNVSSPALSLVAEGVENACRREEYDLVLSIVQTDKELEEDLCKRLVSRKRVDGFILLSDRLNDGLFKDLAKTALPFVLIGRELDTEVVPQVFVDNRGGLRMAVEHLVGLGHRKIGYVSPLIETSTSLERLQGYQEALRESGIEYDGFVTVDRSHHMPVNEKGGISLLSRSDRPTAVCAYSDLVAMGVLKAAKGLGLKVPEELSIIGFDDIEASKLVDPPLTTIHQPLYEMGYTAAGILLAQINGCTPKVRKEKLKTNLVIRGSSRFLNNGR